MARHNEKCSGVLETNNTVYVILKTKKDHNHNEVSDKLRQRKITISNIFY